MILLKDVGRLLQAASHALAAERGGHIDGLTDGPAPMPPVGGLGATGYVAGSAGSGNPDGLHVDHVGHVSSVHADHENAVVKGELTTLACKLSRVRIEWVQPLTCGD